MKRHAIATMLVLLAVDGHARIEAPDHVIYGNATLFGEPAAPGQTLRVQLLETGEFIAEYELGRDQRLGDQFSLRIPMDGVDPRVEGRARPGDPVSIFIEDTLAASTTVGQQGVAVRLDIDPQNLGTGPSLAISDVTLFEGNAGTTAAVFDVSLNTTSDDDVVLFWATEDQTAVGGGSCAPGVDYLSDDSSLTLPPGQMQGSITILVCGDTVIEATETFRIRLNGVQGGVPARPEAIATIIDDDDVPSLRVADVTVIEPAAGATTQAVFNARLTKNSDFEARFDYTTEPLNAVPGTDYLTAAGSVTIPAGELAAEIPVTILHAPGSGPPKSFRLRFSDPFNLILDQGPALGVIQDPAFRPALIAEQEVVNQRDVIGLARPTALALAPDDRHAYVTSEALDAVLVFARDGADGSLALIERIDAGSAGFSDALLDGALDVTVSLDGAHVYVAAALGNAVAVFARDAASGRLSFVQNQVDGEVGAADANGPTAGLEGVRKLVLSPDGAHLYAAGAAANAVAVFERDPSSGALRFLEAEVGGEDDPDDAGATVQGMSRPAGLALASGGAELYVASRFGDAVQVFARDSDPDSTDFGRLSFVTAYENGLDGIVGLDGAFGIGVSGDDAHVYVTAENENAVVLFDRASDGLLAQRSVWRHEMPDRPGLIGAQGLAVSPDGLEVFATGFADHSLTVFKRIQQDDPDGETPPGRLDVRQTLFDEQGATQYMAGPSAVTASFDDRHIYIVANQDNAILVFSRIPVDSVFFDDFESP